MPPLWVACSHESRLGRHGGAAECGPSGGGSRGGCWGGTRCGGQRPCPSRRCVGSLIIGLLRLAGSHHEQLPSKGFILIYGFLSSRMYSHRFSQKCRPADVLVLRTGAAIEWLVLLNPTRIGPNITFPANLTFPRLI